MRDELAPQIVLILAVIMLVPRTSPLVHEKSNTIQQLQHAKVEKYAIVFDAGSTGSRIHVFKFEQEGSKLTLISDTFEQLKPGLSANADDPQKAADSLKPLIAVALKAVPEASHVRAARSIGTMCGSGPWPHGRLHAAHAERAHASFAWPIGECGLGASCAGSCIPPCTSS